MTPLAASPSCVIKVKTLLFLFFSDLQMQLIAVAFMRNMTDFFSVSVFSFLFSVFSVSVFSIHA